MNTKTNNQALKELNRELTPAQIEEFARELDELREEIRGKVGQEDADYIRRMVNVARYNEVFGRLLIHFSLDPVTWLAGVGMLSLSKILDNMEIGHNVMHGQFDWMNDPHLNSRNYDWDNAADSAQWKYSHNYMHHTFTNIIGKDHDYGYNLLRLSEEQKWNPVYLLQIVSNFILMLGFQYGVGLHGPVVEFKESTDPEKDASLLGKLHIPLLEKSLKQSLKDYVLFPALGGFFAPKIFMGNMAANMTRNIWAHAVIFCGHFTETAQSFTPEVLEDETRGDWYLRQLQGSSNIEGSKLLYILTGHLSHQIEHHMFPDIPANRYEEIAPRLRDICERYGQNYNTGPFARQLTSVWKRIFAYSFPDPIARGLMAG